jgi:hypothetical protein
MTDQKMTTSGEGRAGVSTPLARAGTAEAIALGSYAEGDGLKPETGRSVADLWRTALHEAGHICASRYLNLEVAGATVVEGPSYTGLTWGPGSKRALRGKAAYDDDDSAAHDAVALRVADNISRFMTGPGEDRVDEIFSSVQARTIDLMGGSAAEMVFLGDAPPRFMASDMLSANAIAGIICSTPASVAALVEHSFQEALAIIEQNKSVVLALARALIDHPERTLNAVEIDQVIGAALAAEAAEVEAQRRRDWKRIAQSAASFADLIGNASGIGGKADIGQLCRNVAV